MIWYLGKLFSVTSLPTFSSCAGGRSLKRMTFLRNSLLSALLLLMGVPLDVKVRNGGGVFLDEDAAGLDLVAHEHAEDAVGLDRVFGAHLKQGAAGRVHGGLPQ